MKKFFPAFFLFFLIVATVGQKIIFAQEKPAIDGVAVNIEITDTSAGPGDIISVSKDFYKRSDVAYDDKIYGVIADSPVISFEPKTEKTKSVVSNGQVQVKVTNANGNIVPGDFITTSTNPGVGQKATQSGFIIGKALASYNSSQVGLVPVAIAIGYNQVGAGGVQKSLIQSIVTDPNRLKLILSTLISLIVLVGAIVAFTRFVNTGVTSIGRNPLARGVIIRGMFISGSVVLVILILGLGTALGIIFFAK